MVIFTAMDRLRLLQLMTRRAMAEWRDEVRLGNLPHSAITLMGGSEELPLPPGIRVPICVLNSARGRLPALVKKAD